MRRKRRWLAVLAVLHGRLAAHAHGAVTDAKKVLSDEQMARMEAFLRKISQLKDGDEQLLQALLAMQETRLTPLIYAPSCIDPRAVSPSPARSLAMPRTSRSSGGLRQSGMPTLNAGPPRRC